MRSKELYSNVIQRNHQDMMDITLNLSERGGMRLGETLQLLSKSCFLHGRLPVAINTTWVTLELKISNPSKIEDYIPISMIGCLYKIISKVIANRLIFCIG